MTLDELHALPPDQIAPAVVATSNAEFRKILTELLRRDLLARPVLAVPEAREAVDATAEMAAHLHISTKQLTIYGGSEADSRAHLSTTKTLLRGLLTLGAENVDGTLAENVARDALAVGTALLELLPAAGHA
jgi:hypothetical protein